MTQRVAIAPQPSFGRASGRLQKDLRDFIINLDARSDAFNDVQLTAAQVNALAAANIELVPAPAAGLVLIPTAVYCFLDFGAAAFVQDMADDIWALRYSAGNEIAELGAEAAFTAFIEGIVDRTLSVEFSGLAAIAADAASAIDLDMNGGTESITGTGCTISVRTYFKTVPFAAFTATT